MPDSGAQRALNDVPGVADFLKNVASLGEGGDDSIVHAQSGDTVFPVEKIKGNPEVQKLLRKAFQIVNIDPARFVVGASGNARNARTNLPQFDEAEGAGGGGGGATAGTGDTAGTASGGAAPQGSTGGSLGLESGNLGGNPPGFGGEVGTGHDLGKSSVTSGALGGFGQPDLGPLNSPINSLVNDPVSTLGKFGINTAVGMIPGFGLANSISGLLGGPTVGGVVTGGLKGFEGTAPGTPGPAGEVAGGGALFSPSDQVAQLLGATAGGQPVVAQPTAATVAPTPAPPAAPVAAAATGPSKQDQLSLLFNTLAAQGVTPETDSRYIAAQRAAMGG